MNAKVFTIVVAALMILVMVAAQPIDAASYMITVQTDASSYSGAQTLIVSGTISPAPGPGTAVFVKIINPSGTPVDFSPASVNGSTGSYQQSFVLGGSSSWIAGTYTVNATWGNSASTRVSGTATFVYSPIASTTTTTTTSTTTSTSSTSTSTTSTTTTQSTTTNSSTTTTVITTTSSTLTRLSTTSPSTSSTTTTTSSSSQGGGGIPEFPFQVLATTLFTVLVLASYLLTRRYAVLGGRLRGQ